MMLDEEGKPRLSMVVFRWPTPDDPATEFTGKYVISAGATEIDTGRDPSGGLAVRFTFSDKAAIVPWLHQMADKLEKELGK